MNLSIPLGTQTTFIAISQTLPDIRLSLRTTDPAESRARQAVISADLAIVWQSGRDGACGLA